MARLISLSFIVAWLFFQRLVSGELVVCPNELVTLNCVATDIYDWSGSAFNCPDNPNPNNIRLSVLGIGSIVPTCGEFNVTVIEVTAPMITSQLVFIANPGLDGSTITCIDTSDGIVLNETIRIGDTTPTMVVATAINDTCVDVDFMTPSDTRQCIQNYMATATDSAGTTTVGSVEGNSTSLTATVCGLCPSSCDYSFTVQGVSNVFGLGDPSTPEPLTAEDGCPSDFSLTSLNNMCINTVVEATLSSPVVAAGDCLNTLPSSDVAINETSIVWNGLMQCSNVSFEVHPRCCSPLATSMYLGPAGSFSAKITTSYICANSEVQVTLTGNNNYPPGTEYNLVVVDESQNQVNGPPNSPMVNVSMMYDNYTASANPTCGNCMDNAIVEFVPNIIRSHQLLVTSNKSAEVKVTYADCVDDTSNFMVEINFEDKTDETADKSQEMYPFNTNMFYLSGLTPGSTYHYEISVTENGAQIGEIVTGMFMVPKTSGGLSVGEVAGISAGSVIVISIVVFEMTVTIAGSVVLHLEIKQIEVKIRKKSGGAKHYISCAKKALFYMSPVGFYYCYYKSNKKIEFVSEGIELGPTGSPSSSTAGGAGDKEPEVARGGKSKGYF